MTETDDDLVRRSLTRLAEHAPPAPTVAPRPEPRTGRRLLAPAAVAAVVLGIALASSLLPGGGADRAGDPAAETPAPTPAPTQDVAPATPAPTPEALVQLTAADSFARLSADCATWTPPSTDAVVTVERLEPGCIAEARRDVTTVLVAPYSETGPFGESWDETTRPWRSLDGHDVRRLASGPLAEMSSRVVDALVCRSCDQVIVVLGPDPATVRALVDSAASTS